MEEREALSPKEQIKEYLKLKEELLKAYHAAKEELAYAPDMVEEGLIKEKREKLARQIKALAAKVKALEEATA